ncbi:hypothetical protein [Flavobacterium omnivorum]
MTNVQLNKKNKILFFYFSSQRKLLSVNNYVILN